MRRKGELSPAAIDSGWPYQVALRADFVAGKNHGVIEQAKQNLGACPRGHSVRRGEVGFVVYCFSDPINADIFMQKFNGERFDPKDRGRGDRWWEWKAGPYSSAVLRRE